MQSINGRSTLLDNEAVIAASCGLAYDVVVRVTLVHLVVLLQHTAEHQTACIHSTAHTGSIPLAYTAAVYCQVSLEN